MTNAALTTAIFSILGIILGGSLQYLFTQHLDRQRAFRDARTKAYTDYLKCVSEEAHPSQTESTDGHELSARTADAKCRVCLYGSPDVISAFADFERLGATMRTPEERDGFTRMVAAMRKDTAGVSDASGPQLKAILLAYEKS